MDTNKGVARAFQGFAMAHQFIPASLKLKPIELLLNRLFATEIDADEVDFLRDKSVAIEVPDVSLSFSVSLVNKRLRVRSETASADARMSANSTDFLLLIHNKVDPDTLFFRRQLRVEGNTELGLSLKNFLDTIEVDQKLPQPLFRLGDKLASYLQQRKDEIIVSS